MFSVVDAQQMHIMYKNVSYYGLLHEAVFKEDSVRKSTIWNCELIETIFNKVFLDCNNDLDTYQCSGIHNLYKIFYILEGSPAQINYFKQYVMTIFLYKVIELSGKLDEMQNQFYDRHKFLPNIDESICFQNIKWNLIYTRRALKLRNAIFASMCK